MTATKEQCTWKDCEQDGTIPRESSDGEVWARLCIEHDAQLTKAESEVASNPARLLSYWIKAQGGSQKAAARMSR